jgi:hypothetical protein
MADDLRIVASNIAASLITSGAVSVKDKEKDNVPVVKNAVNVFRQVLDELKDRERQGIV